ncbi:phage head completion protein [Clostridium sporogenes]|uniref:phage head completion protein n=1 Tax=Clostridium sporogenes TaxID=1509 RepID=UPI002237EE67|nr:head-tail adaptor protein [Clostridium sporogenes]MCW6112415.1 head-tail adaptor protein [Clostridium sporogenes]
MASINRDMNPILLETKVKTRTPSGATKEEWKESNTIEVAIYDIDDRINTQSVKFNDSSHTGLTRHKKDIKEGINRLRKGDTVYNILSAKTKGRLTQLYLKVVDTNV